MVVVVVVGDHKTQRNTEQNRKHNLIFSSYFIARLTLELPSHLHALTFNGESSERFYLISEQSCEKKPLRYFIIIYLLCILSEIF